MSDIHTDRAWLIVGQGLAGSVLALELVRRGERVFVVDGGLPGAASRVAAGVFNPVTGRRMQPTWQAAILWQALETFYPAAEQLLGSHFYHALPNVRPLFTQAERIDAEKQARTNTLSPWIEVIDSLPWQPSSQVVAQAGAVYTKRAGYVDVPIFCQALRRWLVEKGSFMEARADEADLTETDGQIEWGKGRYRGVIWADGYFGAKNPAMAGLPLAPLKGEILLVRPIESPTLAGAVLNRGAYLAPRIDGSLWAGSTYEHQFADIGPTEAGRASIMERIGRFYLPSLSVVQHLGGVRPSVLDRRPIAGPLLGKPGHYAFTGLGTKGVSLAPWLARVLADHLLYGAPIPAEIAVRYL